MDDLTEFLRARLDEDEATWRRDQAEGSAADTPWMVDRMLREVAAKRAILAEYEQQDGWYLPDGVAEGRDDDERACDEAARYAWQGAVAILAGTYCDHPDYRTEWKP